MTSHVAVLLPTGPLPTVSVVIPCYNYGSFLPECVDSVLAQPHVDVRVLIIDDASPDGSAAVADRIAASDRRVSVVRHLVNRGHLRTYNEGLAWADGEYAVLLSADDRLAPGALARAALLLHDHPSVGFVYGRPVYFSGRAPRLRSGPGRQYVWPGQVWLRDRCRDGYNVISSPEVVVRTSLLHRVGGFREGLPHAGDLDLWLRLAAHANVGYLRGTDQALYRRHVQSMSRATFNTHLVDLEQRRAAFLAVLDDEAVPVRDRAALRRDVCRALARQALRRACRAYDRSRTTEVPVDDLVRFAQDTWEDLRALPEWRGLVVRRRIGARVMPYLQPIVLTAPAHRVRSWLWWQSWRRRGMGW